MAAHQGQPMAFALANINRQYISEFIEKAFPDTLRTYKWISILKNTQLTCLRSEKYDIN